jgi:hypothetical protein
LGSRAVPASIGGLSLWYRSALNIKTWVYRPIPAVCVLKLGVVVAEVAMAVVAVVA